MFVPVCASVRVPGLSRLVLSCLCVCASVCRCVCLSACLPVCLSACLLSSGASDLLALAHTFQSILKIVAAGSLGSHFFMFCPTKHLAGNRRFQTMGTSPDANDKTDILKQRTHKKGTTAQNGTILRTKSRAVSLCGNQPRVHPRQPPSSDQNGTSNKQNETSTRQQAGLQLHCCKIGTSRSSVRASGKLRVEFMRYAMHCSFLVGRFSRKNDLLRHFRTPTNGAYTLFALLFYDRRGDVQPHKKQAQANAIQTRTKKQTKQSIRGEPRGNPC